MDTMLIVDNEAPGPRAFADILSFGIDRVTCGKIGVEELLNVILEDALDQVKARIHEANGRGHTIRWLLIDLADEYAKVADAGARLLDQIKRDNDTKEVPVVIYTSKYVEVNIRDLLSRGAVDVIIRDPGGHKRIDDLAREVLDAFRVSYEDAQGT